MPVTCPNYRETVLAQTLFLGASVVSFSSNVGWGGRSSSLTVELIEDLQPTPFGNIPHYNAVNYPYNHYYNCSGDDCFVDELGIPYKDSLTKKEKNAPGKMFYQWIGNSFVSSYWNYQDPGFFATGTYVQPDGSINRNGPINVYDIIDTPVYFKFDRFEFIGLVKSWNRDARPGSISYSVTIESLSSLLNNSHVILQDFDGAISSDPTDSLAEGNISNLFNVYGFLESMGYNRFGGANLNSNGISAKSVIDSIQILTSTMGSYSRTDDALYSPFGRILSKSIRRVSANGNRVNDPHITNMNSFGVICANAPRRSFNSIPYNSFSLDLSSIPSPPYDYRISGSPSETISSIIDRVIEDTGLDYLAVTVPVRVNDGVEFVIKIITVSRTQFNPTYQIPTLVSNLESAGFNVENSSFGQESNQQNNVRKIVFGGNQQRYYQAKTYRLAYAQNNYIWNPVLNQFVNNLRSISKVRNPLLRSNKITDVVVDDLWGDSEVSRPEGVIKGNYFFTRKFFNNPRSRYIPLFRDIICPYFGTKLDVKYEPTSDSNIFRFVRPVYLDTWTNQIVITFSLNELPQLSIGDPLTLYQSDVINNNQDMKDNTTDSESDEAETGAPEEKDIANSPQPQDSDSESTDANNTPPPPPPPPPQQESSDGNNTTQSFKMLNTKLVVNNNFQNMDIKIQQDEETSDNSPGDETPTESPIVNIPSTDKEPENNKPAPDADNNNNGTATEERKTDEDTKTAKESDRNVTRTLEYNTPGFTIKETELRCPSFDSYLTYCLGKSFFSKPDLFVMLVNAYKAKGIFLESPPPNNPNKENLTLLPGAGLGAPAEHRGATTTSVEDGVQAEARDSIKTKMAMNWDLYLNHNFIKDLQILYEFVKNLSEKYYGKQFMVKLPDIYAYKDTSYLDIALPGTTNSFFVYQGSQEIKFNYELTNGAWEEPGNYVDDSFLFGDNYWQIFRNDDGLMPAIAGYNNSYNIDDVVGYWCRLPQDKRQELLDNQLKINQGRRLDYVSNIPEVRALQIKLDDLRLLILTIQQELDLARLPKPEQANKSTTDTGPPPG